MTWIFHLIKLIIMAI